MFPALIASKLPIELMVRVPPSIPAICGLALTSPSHVRVPPKVKERLPGLLAVWYWIILPLLDFIMFSIGDDPEMSITDPVSNKMLPLPLADKFTAPPFWGLLFTPKPATVAAAAGML